MSKPKVQKSKDLEELTAKLAKAKGIVFTGYIGTTVKDLDKFRKDLRKENVFAKVYKLTLVKKAMKAAGLAGEIMDYKTPVILAASEEDETAPARIIKSLTKDLKTISILEGIMEGKIFSKSQVETMGDLPSKDQLRAQLLATFMAPISAFARVLNAYVTKMGETAQAVAAEAPSEPAAPAAA
jgi:large subunit ribosomal protein L10